MTLMLQTTMEALYWMSIVKFCSGVLVGFLLGLGIREVIAKWKEVRHGKIPAENL